MKQSVLLGRLVNLVFDVPLNSWVITGPQLKVPSNRLRKPGIEPMTPVLQEERLNHYTIEASKEI